jgi:hypothetical protein
MLLKNFHLQKYHDDGFFNIEGFCNVGCFNIVDLIDSSNINSQGGVCEIGVHHGKFYMLLNSVTESTELSFAVDIFDRQDLNIDKSGKGNKFLFETNLKNLDRHGGKQTEIISGDSTDSGLNLVDAIGLGTMRYVSIDGGHTVFHTLNDLKIAEKIVINEGVVVLDDICSNGWLGVVEGTVKYLSTHPTLVPFAVGYNKLWMCKLSYHKKYLELLNDCNFHRKWPQKFVGHDIVTI